MKNSAIILSVIVFSFFLLQCSKNKSVDPEDNSNNQNNNTETDNGDSTNDENNNNTIDCSTISYADVDAIFKANCAPCHTGSGNSGTINLENYTNAVSAAEQTRFLQSLKQDNQDPSNFATAMPPTGQLNDSLIQKIECWINENFPN